MGKVLDSEEIAKNREKEGKKRGKSGKNQEKEEKSGRKGRNREGSFTLPLLANRAGYATICKWNILTSFILSETTFTFEKSQIHTI